MNSPEPMPANGRAFALAVLDAAAQAEAAERQLKEAVLTAARSGNVALIERVVARWLMQSASEVLKNGLD
jgi:hypothetical protein